MAPHRRSTPLISLEAVALDTETTGLDARTARIVEIAVLKLRGDRVLAEDPFQRLVNPGVAMPPTATGIHGLADADVRSAPRFPDMAAELDGILGEATVIGHDIGYDLTVLAREYALAGRSWRVPRALDVGSLARVAMPTLARYSLDALCDWQEIRIERRHRAIPDARAAAELFVKLIPMLRARNIRTLAEAEAACGALLDEAPRGVRTGWIVPGRESDAADSTPALARLDSFPYRHRVRDVMSAPAVTAAGALTARDALAILLEKRISSVIVTGSEGRVGIVTERDLLRALRDEAPGKPAPRLQDIMRHPLQTVPEEAFIYRAIGRMDRLGDPASGRRQSPERDRRHRKGAGPAASAGDGGDRARRRDRQRGGRGRARGRVGEASVGGAQPRRRGCRSRERHAGDKRRDLRPDRAGGAHRGAAPGRRRPGRAAGALCGDGAGIGRPRREPARGRPGQCHRLCQRRARRPGGPLVRRACRPHVRHPRPDRRSLLPRRRDGEERRLPPQRRRLAKRSSTAGSNAPSRSIC